MKNNDYSVYKNIILSEDLNDFFSRGAIELLWDCNIITLEDLFSIRSDIEFIEKLSSVRSVSNHKLHNEIIGTCKILKCKYLSCDPMIDLDNLEYINIDVDFGFSSRTVGSFKRNNNCTISKLLNMYKENDFSELYQIRNLGKNTIDEIINKVSVVCDFYNTKKEDNLEPVKQESNVDAQNDLQYYFSTKSITLLNESGIKSVNDLIKVSDAVNLTDLIYNFRGIPLTLQREIVGTYKLLKYKFQKVDLCIDFTNLQSEDIYKLGFSAHARNCMVKYCMYNMRRKYEGDCYSSWFINLIKNKDILELYKVRGLGDKTLIEIINKVNILHEYYKDKELSSKNNNLEDDNLYELFNELKELIEENKRITEKIEFVQSEIEKRMTLKGDCSKCMQKKI